MSPIWSSILTALGGILTGLALAATLLWRQRQALTRARYTAAHDDTTGLPNRRALLAALSRATRDGTLRGLVLLDLDDFKTVNDTFGHEAGNDLLTQVGARLTTIGHPVRLAARLSGDEFALLVAGGPDEVTAAARAAFHAVGSRPVRLDNHSITVTASVGHATAGVGVTARTLLHHADMAMYQAKQAGGGVRAASPAHHSPAPGARCRDRRH